MPSSGLPAQLGPTGQIGPFTVTAFAPAPIMHTAQKRNPIRSTALLATLPLLLVMGRFANRHWLASRGLFARMRYSSGLLNALLVRFYSMRKFRASRLTY